MPAPKVVTRAAKIASAAAEATTTADYWTTENNQAIGMSAATNIKRFAELCESLKSKMRAIETIRKTNGNANVLKIASLRTSCAATIVALRKLNRLDKHRLKATRDTVKENRARVDGLHLQLQNLAYEAGYLRSEVNKCLEFKSMHEQIELISLDEFLKAASEDIHSSKSEHEITMARLQHELTIRHELAKRLESSVSRKRDLIKDIEAKETVLSKIQPTLNNILEAAQPIYSQLGMTLQRSQPEHANAQFLCRPLYVIYVEANAFQEVYPETLHSVSIDGDVDEAKRMLDKMTGGDEESESDIEEVVVVKKKKRKSRTSSKTANQEDQNQLKAFLKPFPLSVKVTLTSENGKTFLLRFSYINSLKIVCAKLELNITEVDSFLDELFPQDNGLQSPNPTTHYLLAKNGVDNLDRALSVCNLGKPYQWAQWLAGLDFMSSSVTSLSSELSRKHFEQTLRMIKERLLTRVVLNEQLGQLAEGNVVAIEGRFPKKVSTSLDKFRKITKEDAMIRVGYGNATEAVKEMMSKDSLFFEAKISKESNKYMTAVVSIPQTYPETSPFWFFTFEGSTSVSSGILKDLERTVNCYSEGDPSHLLSQQAMQALVSFEVMLDVDSLKVIRKNSGKDRAKPFNYEPSVGIFTPI